MSRLLTLTARAPLQLILRRNMATVAAAASSVRVPAPIVPASWLKANYPHVKVLDGSWYMPNEKQDPHANFLKARLPGARFFDLEACTSKEGSNATCHTCSLLLHNSASIYSSSVWLLPMQSSCTMGRDCFLHHVFVGHDGTLVWRT